MSEAYSADSANPYDGVAVVSRAAADWLSFAAAPTFATMAIVAAVLGGGAEPFCSAAQHLSLVGGMVPMYLLMSAFHSGPWLRLVSRRRAAL
jgi:hypothetical protein